MRRQEAASSNGQDAVLSSLRWEFDPPRCYQEFVCLKGVRCDAGSFNGRTRVFEARHERSIRSPGSQICCELKIRGVVKATVTSHLKKTPLLIVPSSCCGVIQLDRITGSDPVHARSNRALATKLRVVAESSGRMPDCLSGGTGSTPVATAKFCEASMV